jgi:WD40 repeat protein
MYGGDFGRGATPDPGLVRTRQEFARELTLLRERAGLTVRDVAKAIGVPDSTVGGYFSGRYLPGVKPHGQFRSLLVACGETDAAAIEQWLEALSRVRPAPGRRPVGAPVPYRGLASYQQEDAEWFYGRGSLTDDLLAHLRKLHAAGGMLMVVGPSGSGKSSLLRAGMIPALKAGAVGAPGSRDWPVRLLTPGPRPAGRISWPLPADAGLGEPVSADHMVLVIDQFEEIFTACQDEHERQAVIAALCDAAGHETGPLTCPAPACSETAGPAALVVLALRADFYPHALRYPELVAALREHQVLVGPMTDAELRTVVIEPARKAKLDVEDGLVEVLLRDLAPAGKAGEPWDARSAGSLPLLSHAMLATWERSRRGRLTVAGYQDSGGIQGAVAQTAEAAYSELTHTQRTLARQVFLQLVHVGDDTADTRRRLSVNDLPPGSDVRDVLDLFIRQRLITASADDIAITHEALLYAWPRLRGWIDADREWIQFRDQLGAAARAWQESGHDPDDLYRGARLLTVRDWAADPGHSDSLSVLERAFLQASAEQMLAEERAGRRRTRRLQRLVAALGALSLVAGTLAVFAFQQKQAATYQRDLAISRQVATDADQLRATDVNLAMQLSLAAYEVSPTPEARSSLLESYATPAVTRMIGSPGVMEAAAYTPVRHVIAAAGEDSTIRLWNAADLGRPVSLGPPLATGNDAVFSLAFSPDGRTLASGGADKAVHLWNVTDPARPVPWTAPLTGPAGTVYSVAFSPDGTLLAAGSADDRIWLWNIASPRHPIRIGLPLRGPVGYVQSVAFSPDGRILAAGCEDGTIWLWNITVPGHPVRMDTLTDAAKAVFSVTFSPDGRSLAAGSADDKVRLWNVTRPDRPVPAGAPLTGPAGWVSSVAFSPDGQSVAAASSDSNVWIWNLATRKVTFLPHPAPVTAVLYLPGSQDIVTSAADGIARIWQIPSPQLSDSAAPVFAVTFAHDHILAVIGSDNTARLWNVASPRQPVPVGPVLADVTRSPLSSGAGALSPDGKTLIACASGASCQIWDMSDRDRPRPVARIPGPAPGIQFAAFSPDGHLLAVTGNDNTVWLWNMTDPARPVLAGRSLTGPAGYGLDIAFSPDGRVLALADADKKVYLWDISDPDRPVALKPLTGASSYAYSVAFSPNGDVLAEGSADNQVRLWDISDLRRPFLLGSPLAGPAGYVYSVAFSPDGRTLAATAGDGTIWLWNITTPAQPSLLATLTGPAGAVYIDAFDSNRDILATAGNDGTVRLWDTDTSQVAAYICSIAGDGITPAEWAKYIPGLPYNPPCRSVRR